MVVAAAALSLVIAAQGQPRPAYASITLVVDNFTDLHAGPGATTCTPGACTLRAALEIADNRAAAGTPDLNTTVQIPTATITLTLGALQVGARPNQVITITGNGSANTIINMGACVEGGIATSCSVLLLDPATVGNVTAHISGLTLNGGHTASVAGGAGLQAGSVDPLAPDNTDLTNCVVSGNTVTGGNNGGGISYAQGNLTLANVTLSNNTANGNGGGLDYAGDQNLTISNSTISGNSSTTAGSGGGGGIHLLSTSGTYTIVNTTFTNNTTPSAPGSGSGGGAIFSETGTLNITASTFTGNSAGPNGAGGAIYNRLGNLTMHQSRLVGNTAQAVLGGGLYANAGTVDVQNNWWGTNTPKTTATLAGPAVTGGSAPTRWYQLKLLVPASVTKNTSAAIHADLGHDNVGGVLSALPNVTTIPVTWPPPSLGSVSGADTFLNAGSVANATFNAGGTAGTALVHVTADGYQVDASIEIPLPPTIAKAFSPTSIPLNTNSRLTLTFHNPNTVTPLTGVGVFDVLPAGVGVANTPNVADSCGGSFIANPGASTITVSGGALAVSPGPASTCTFAVDVTGLSAGDKSNTTNPVTSTEGGTGLTASATLTVVAPPSIAKAFSPTSIPRSTTSSLQFTLTNPGANTVALTGVGFTDTLPTGLTVASGSSGACGGTLTTTAPTGIALSGGSIATSSQCVFSVTVTGAAAGSYTNTTGNVSSTNGGTGNTASASLTVVGPPSLTKAFSPTSIPLNGTTSVLFTITNPNSSVTLTNLSFTDFLPAGLQVANPANASNAGCGGTWSAPPGATSIGLGGGTLAGGASCTLSADLTGTTAGVKNNSTQPFSVEGGSGATASASVVVVAPPSMIKAFGSASIPLSGTTTLTFTITNANATTALTGVGFVDNLPAGLVVASPPGVSSTCGGSVTATAGAASISLSGGNVSSSSSCAVAVNVTGVAAGNQNNTSGGVTSTEGGTGNTASATINVVAQPALTKAFNPSTIPLNTTTSLTFAITNPAANTVALNGVGFTDTLPTGLTVGNSSATVCGGTLTTTAPTGIALSGATVNVNSQCQFAVTVTGAASGSYTNTTGNVTSTNGGTGNTASAGLTVASPPTITKAFQNPAIALNSFTSLTFNILNPNTSLPLTGVAFSDTLPAGLVISTPNGQVDTCGGTVTATPGASSISLSGGTIAAGGGCQVRANVTGTTTGVKNNTSGPVSANESGPGATSNTATVTVTSITLSSNANPVTEGAPPPVVYTAQVQPVPPGGTVDFFDAVNPIAGCSGVAPNGAGVATCSVGIYPTANTHPVRAIYSLGSALSNIVAEVVNDAALTALPGSNLSGTEEVAIPNSTVLATFTDANPNGVASDFTATVSWGDGTFTAGTVSAGPGGGFQVTGGHTYEDAGTYSILVHIVDTKGGASADASLAASIADVSLQVTCNQNLNSTAGRQFSGQVASVFDANKEALSEYAATIDWGDGTSSAGSIADPPGTLLISGTHTYAAAGTYTITVTVRELDPNAAAASSASGTFAVAAVPGLPSTGARDDRFRLTAILALVLALFSAGLWLAAHRRRRRL